MAKTNRYVCVRAIGAARPSKSYNEGDVAELDSKHEFVRKGFFVLADSAAIETDRLEKEKKYKEGADAIRVAKLVGAHQQP